MKIAIISAALLSTQLLNAQSTSRLTVHFPLASSEISMTDMEAIRTLCTSDDVDRITSIALKGHADERGTDAANMALSARRAERVRQVLNGTCLSNTTVTVEYNGERDPLSNGSQERDHAANRCVEILLQYEDARNDQARDLPKIDRIRPLMPGAEVAREHFRVEPSRPIEFVTNDGTRVRIPANAIVDKRGSPVEGLVDITYRSFSDMWATVASGVPMHVGSGPDAGHMESIGMYEVIASQHGVRVDLVDGDVISLTPGSPVQRTSDFRDWQLDEATGEWREETSTAMIASTDQENFNERITEAYAKYFKAMQNIPIMPDSTKFADRMASDSYCYMSPCSPAARTYARKRDKLVSPYSDPNIPQIQVVAERRAFGWQSVTGFKILFGPRHAHNEWSAFPKDRIWAYNGPLNRREFHKVVARKHYYQDVHLEVADHGTKGIIRLKDRGTWVELPVELSYQQATDRDRENWVRDLSNYYTRYNAKQKRFDRELKEKVDNTADRIRQQRSSAWNDSRRVMVDEEPAMTADEFDGYVKQTYARNLVGMRNSAQPAVNALTTSFTMRGFGMYNCDMIRPRESVRPSQIAVVDPEGEPFRWSTAFGVIAGKKAVVTYWGNGSGSNDEMTLSKAMANLLFVGAAGEMVLVKRPADAAGRDKVVFSGKRVEQPKGPDELATLMAQ